MRQCLLQHLAFGKNIRRPDLVLFGGAAFSSIAGPAHQQLQHAPLTASASGNFHKQPTCSCVLGRFRGLRLLFTCHCSACLVPSPTAATKRIITRFSILQVAETLGALTPCTLRSFDLGESNLPNLFVPSNVSQSPRHKQFQDAPVLASAFSIMLLAKT